MRFVYEKWDGMPFPTGEHLQLFQQFMEYVMDFGQPALDAVEEMALDPEQQKLIEQWVKDGLLEKVGMRFRLTARAVSSLERKALSEVFRGLRPDHTGGHETTQPGAGMTFSDTTREYVFGDPPHAFDMHQTLRSALAREGPGLPIRCQESDFAVRQTESQATCSTAILLDMSASMSRWHRFSHAKRCAMAVYALIRQRFVQDTVDLIGFASGAEIIPEHRLPLARPKDISLFDPVVHMRVPIEEIDRAPQHFTNLQAGLALARRVLERRGGVNRQVFIITDGQPTAHMEGGHVHLVYPPSEASAMASLSEAAVMRQRGIRFSTFALIEDYAYMDWTSFVDQLTHLTRGVAFYCAGGDLAQCVMESYLSGRKCRSHLA